MEKMHMVLGLALVAVALLSGCLSIKVEDHGYEALRDSNGDVVVDKDGKAQLIHKGQTWKYYKHWFEQTAEEIDFSRRPGDDISVAVKNYRDVVSAELNKLVETSFKGAAELAAKVGAAIATSGGSVAGEAGFAALKNCISKFVSQGGDVSKATVECKNGLCTISDGSVAETCANCFVDGN
jgi:hypothetical protein